MELAAARVTSMAPAEIAAHLDERFQLLVGRRRGTVERHQTLRATLDWSYSLLGERAARLRPAGGVRGGLRRPSGPAGLRTAVLGAAAYEATRRGDPSALILGQDALRDGLHSG
jgi:hypothetical protein